MENRKILEMIIERLNSFEGIYDTIRLVDPVEKLAYRYVKNGLDITIEGQCACFEIWDRSSACTNCTSSRALISGSAKFKMETTGDNRVFLLTSIPLHEDDRRFVIELIKDVSEDGMFDPRSRDLRRDIERRNEAVVMDAMTKIFSERYILERLPSDIRTALKNGYPTTVFVVRFENISLIDEVFGRLKTAHLMARIASSIKSFIRNESDWASRYKDDEFVVVMNGLSRDLSKRVGARMHQRLSAVRLEDEPDMPVLTFSIGSSTMDDIELSADEMIERASVNLVTPPNLSESHEKFFDAYSLTEREKEVVLLIFNGERNEKIAKILFVGLSTVKKHISSILKKTGTTSRAELISKLNSV